MLQHVNTVLIAKTAPASFSTAEALNDGDIALFDENRKILTDAEKADNISNFYTGLSLDGRFVNLGDNEWDLRANQTYDKVHIDMNDVYSDIEEETKGNRDLEEFDHEEIEAEGLDEDLDDEDSDEDEEDYDRFSKEDL